VVLTKIKKVGGSTLGGILRRFGKHNGLHGYSTNSIAKVMSASITEPKVLAAHAEGHKLASLESHFLGTIPVFHVTALREPASRCISHYYFMSNRFQRRVSDEGLVAFCNNQGDIQAFNYQFNYAKKHAYQPVKMVFEMFDVIGTAECVCMFINTLYIHTFSHTHTHTLSHTHTLTHTHSLTHTLSHTHQS
jgi:hypothetical protein